MSKKKQAKTGRIELRIAPDLKKRAQRAADADGRKLSNWIERLIEQNC